MPHSRSKAVVRWGSPSHDRYVGAGPAHVETDDVRTLHGGSDSGGRDDSGADPS